MSIEEIVEDWQNIKQRFIAWWQGEIYDRPLLAVTVPRTNNPTPAALIPQESAGPDTPDVQAQWTDIDVMLRRQEQTIRQTIYLGDALPVFWHNWSAGHSLYFGCKPHFTPDTVWVDPAPVDQLGNPLLDGWEENSWWAWMQDCTFQSSQASQGRWFTMPMWGNHAGDNLGLVRGTQQLLLDVAFNRTWVKQILKKLSNIQIKVFDRLWELVDPSISMVEGSINYVSCWAPGRTMGFDCDISCMFSPCDYKEIFLPPLRETMATVDHRIYHLDGTVALHHLETLLAVPELHAIQWVPGAGREEIVQWIPLIHRIQAAGKGVAIYVQPEEIPLVLKECRPEGLFINTTCANENDARYLVDQLDKY
jgi:hypothetical protein